MDTIQFAIFIITFVSLFIWNRTEARADARHMDAKLEANRNLSLQIHKENREMIDAISKETREVIDAIREDSAAFQKAYREETAAFQKAYMEETKNFHGRLCTIEERNRK